MRLKSTVATAVLTSFLWMIPVCSNAQSVEAKPRLRLPRSSIGLWLDDSNVPTPRFQRPPVSVPPSGRTRGLLSPVLIGFGVGFGVGALIAHAVGENNSDVDYLKAGTFGEALACSSDWRLPGADPTGSLGAVSR